MFDSLRGELLRNYNMWTISRFRSPKVPDRVRDFLLHLSTAPIAGKYLTLWPHQREAVIRTIYANEVLKQTDEQWRDVLLNIVTGGGKTTIIASLIAYLRVCHDTRSFLLLTPNTVVRERLRLDFERSRHEASIWRRFNLFPPEFSHYAHDMTLHVLASGSSSAGIRSAGVILGNIHQLYDTNVRGEENLKVILNHLGQFAVFNDEAHNTVAPRYDQVLEQLSGSGKVVLRVDTTATPDRADGQNPTSRMIYLYSIREAVRDHVVKSVYVCQPSIKTVELTYTDIETGQIVRVEDVPWEDIDKRHIPASKWVTSPKPLRQQLGMAVRRLDEQKVRAHGRYKPILFVVAVSIKDAHNAHDVLEHDFGLKAFVIASRDDEGSDLSAEQRQAELHAAMTIGTSKDENDYDAVISVLMLREGWDVRSVSVIALLRKFSSQVYGQQVIGRGLRRMFPQNPEERERLVVVDHPKLDHGWLWAKIDAFVKEGVGTRQGLDLDEGVADTEQLSPTGDTSPPTDEDEKFPVEDWIELPDPEEFEERPLSLSWQEYLRTVDYPKEDVVISDEDRTGEIERDLAGTGTVRTLIYTEEEKQQIDSVSDAIIPRTVADLRQEIVGQLFDLTVEVLFNNGLPMSGRPAVYKVLLTHVSEKFLSGKTIGQATVTELRSLQNRLHYIRPIFDRREVLRAILNEPLS